MDNKRAGLRQHFQAEASKAVSEEQYQKRTAQLRMLENTIVDSFSALVRYMDGKTTKTEVVNQLKSISTPDVDKLVPLLSKLDTAIQSNKVDLKPLVAQLTAINRNVSLIPKSHPDKPEPTESVKVTNLSDVKLDTKDVVDAIKALKLDVKAPIINEKEVDLKPLQDVMLDILKAVNNQKPVVIPDFPEIPKTDLTKVETKLDTSNKLLKEITEKKFGGGGGGGGNGTPYINDAGKSSYVTLVDNQLPVVNASLDLQVDDTGTYTYLGNATPGTATSASGWRIKRVVNASGVITHADGVSTFNKEWDERASYAY